MKAGFSQIQSHVMSIIVYIDIDYQFYEFYKLKQSLHYIDAFLDIESIKELLFLYCTVRNLWQLIQVCGYVKNANEQYYITNK